MHLRSGRLVTPTSSTSTMDPSQFDTLTRQLAQLATNQQQLQTQLMGVQNEMAATREENRGLATRLNNLEGIPHPSDADNYEASCDRHYRHRQGGRQHAGCDRRNRGHDHEREQDHYR
jgi:septal ring factor EnvC (AmiA/AmiB activator)